MNTAQDILTYARQRHIHLEGNGERLVVEAPGNLLTEQFLGEVKKHKAELIQALAPATLDEGKNTTVAHPPEPEIKPRLSAEQELKIREWFTSINETDPDIIAELLENCRTNPKLLEYCLELADEPMPIVIHTGNES